MKWWEISLFMLCTSFIHYVYIKSYSLIFKDKMKKIGIQTFIIFLLITLATYYNTFYNYGFSKIIISVLLMCFMQCTIFIEPILKDKIFKSIIIYITGWFFELVYGIFVAYFFINSVQQFDSNITYKLLFSLLMVLTILLFSHIKKYQKIIYNIYKYMRKALTSIVLSIFFIICFALLTYYIIVSTDIFSIITILILISIITFLFTFLIIQSIKAKRADEKQEILLNFMKEYEVIIDEERIDRHEMVNNLLILKSIKDKNSKQYNKILDDILLTYKSSQGIKGIYDLPSGLKGVLYYKIHDMKNKDINVIINISNKLTRDLENLPVKILIKVCKILGILLDNAREAAEKSKIKEILIDMYKDGIDAIIYVENTMPQADINISKIKEKGFSTKGKNRGYGLFLIEKLTSENKKIEVEQKVDNKRFISIIKIKK